MRILIIEDEPEVAKALAKVLEVEGHSPTVAHTGLDGLDRIASESPQAVFLDMKLPGTPGLEVLRRIRARDPALPVVVLTGHASHEEVEAARELGVTDVVEKPWALKCLDEALAGLDPTSQGHRSPG
jgi:DNA-binding response OmpR family regulator